MHQLNCIYSLLAECSKRRLQLLEIYYSFVQCTSWQNTYAHYEFLCSRNLVKQDYYDHIL